jgi:hypothetical protein
MAELCSYVSPKFRHDDAILNIYRTLQLLLGTLMKPELMPLLEESKDSLPSLVKHICEQEQSISPSILEDCVKLIMKAELDVPLERLRFHEFIAVLCIEHVKRNRLEGDISFEAFIQNTALCQFLPQNLRIEAWIRSVLIPNQAPKDTSIVAKFLKQGSLHCRNVHSKHLLAFFISKKDKSTPVLNPAYTYIDTNSDPSISTEDLIFQQCLQCNELKWEALIREWSVFPYSLDFLLSLLLVYSQPLKLLATISHLALFNLFENATASRYGAVLQKIERHVSDKAVNALVSL